MSLNVEKCLQAWTNSLRQMDAKADIVFYGDSLTYYGDFAPVFPDKVVCNLGLRGDTIQGMIDRAEQVGVLGPKQVFLMAGINDVGHCSVDCFEIKYANLVQRILEQGGEFQLIVQSMLPVNNIDFSVGCNNEQIRTCNNVIRQVALRNDLLFLDLFPLFEKKGYLDMNYTRDGIHLNATAYQSWCNVLINLKNY